jgi:hypothetical protein
MDNKSGSILDQQNDWLSTELPVPVGDQMAKLVVHLDQAIGSGSSP